MDDMLSERLLREWKVFQEGGEVDESVIRPSILRSWKRCRQLNVDPNMGNRRQLNADELAEALHRNATILHVARGMMEKLYNPIANSGSIISVADMNGVILHSLYDRQKNYPIPNIVSGSLVTESSSGCNAINLCLEEKRTIETRAAEHYCRSLHEWFCCASPIWSPRNEMMGVLNVTLPYKMYHRHTLGMVESSAYAISEQIRLQYLLKEQRTIFEMIDEGLIVLEKDGRIRSVNHKAQVMLNLSPKKCWINIQDIIFSKDILKALLADNANFHDQEAQILLQDGIVNCMISVVCIGESGTRIVTLREGKRVKDSAARIVGAKAVFSFSHIIGTSPAVQAIVQQAKRAARSDSTILLLGESGTGKELFAQSIHNMSPRATESFITVNCGALPRELVQSELFGYDEGAFTGASRLGKPGKFELADGGTIFLDEIGEMPLDAQVSLLRLLQSGEITRVGSKYTKSVNVRVIAATNRNLLEAIQNQSFREDLYFRLNVIPLHIPPLRERVGDVSILVQHFLQRFSSTLNCPELQITSRALKMLELYSWPGNIRELENTIERMAFMAPESGIIDVEMIPALLPHVDKVASVPVATPHHGMLELIEKENIVKILKENGGNIRASAQILGVSRSGLYVKMKKYGITPNQCRS